MGMIQAESKKICLEVSGVTLQDLCTMENIKAQQEELKIAISQLKLFHSMVAFSEIFEGFPLYYQNFFCYRMRVYPIPFFWSRTSGFYKYFICDFEEKTLDVKGFAAFVFCYLKTEQLRNEFLGFLGVNDFFDLPEKLKNSPKTERITRPGIARFFNRLEPPKIGSDTYFFVLYSEIKSCITDNFKTSFQIEIDQSSSVAMCFALFFNNKGLADLCNMTDVDSNGIYDKLIESLPLLMKEDSFLFPYFQNYRDFCKFLFMTWGYSIKDLGREDLIKKIILEIEGREFWVDNKEILKKESKEIAAN